MAPGSEQRIYKNPLPDWETLVKKYDKDGNGELSKDEFPDDLALIRRLDSGNAPSGAIVTVKMFFDRMLDTDKNNQVSKSEWEVMLKRRLQPAALPHGLLAVRLAGKKDATQASVAWMEERAVPELPVPLVYRDRVYAVTNGGIVSVFEEATGKLVYRGRRGAAREGCTTHRLSPPEVTSTSLPAMGYHRHSGRRRQARCSRAQRFRRAHIRHACDR